MSQFLFKWIFLVPIELIHNPEHVRIVFFFFYWPESLKKTIGTRNWRNVSVSGPRNWPIMPVFGARNYADPFSRILGPETDKFHQFLATEIVSKETDTFYQFLVSIVFPEFWPIEKEKNNLNKLWILYEFNRNKKTPFEHELTHLKTFLVQKLT